MPDRSCERTPFSDYTSQHRCRSCPDQATIVTQSYSKFGLEGPFRGSAAVAAGLVTRDRLYGPRFQRLFPDVYAPAAAESDLLLRSRAAGVYVGGRGVLVGYSAAELLGASCASANAPAEVTVPDGCRGDPAWWCTASGPRPAR
jgi:hypothetical protein